MLSKLDKRCEKCEYKDDCNNKRMCGMMYIDCKKMNTNTNHTTILNRSFIDEISKEIEKHSKCKFNNRF